VFFYRYASMNLALIGATVFMLLGGPWIVLGTPLALLFFATLDERFGDTRRSFSKAKVWFLDSQLYLTLPLLVLLGLAYATMLSSFDPFGIASLVKSATGFDIAARRDATHPIWLAAGAIPVGFFAGTAGINVAHELFHRLGSARDIALARWLLAFSCDTTFAIEHVHGHHRHVGTPEDPATARRGESFYRFFIRSSAGEIANGFRFEAARLRGIGQPVLSWRNLAIRGQLMSLLIAALYVHAAGLAGLVAFIVSAIAGKAYLEAVNYIEHYGLVRVAGTRIEARHSWDCYRKASNALLYNLPRHSDHHLYARKPFWDLKASQSAPLMPHGYQTMVTLALLPRLYFRKMEPLLRTWDETMASEGELKLLRHGGPAKA
jgi:alkane 1-monooxygenase